MSKTYTVEEAAAYCKCHAETIRQYIRKGMIEASRPGRRYCITQAALDVFLAKKENEQMQASLEHRSEEKCRSTYETTFTMSILGQKAATELDNLLALKTNRKRNGCMIN
jgi:toxin-antitoxin system, antitoxin component, xre family